MLDSLALLLDLSGFDVLVASNYREARHQTDKGIIPDMIICDYSLPEGVNGVEL